MLINLENIKVEVAGKTLLDHIDFHIAEGEFVYLIGKVGTGKTSLLKTLYGELPIAGKDGTAQILDYDLHTLKRKQLPMLRRQLGIVFQDFQLLDNRTVFENIDFVLRATGWSKKKLRHRRIEEVLSEVGMADKIQAFPHELSGGEQQRASIARALINDPKIILADEPTGNLDQGNSAEIMRLLRRQRERGTAVVMVTHNLHLLEQYPGIVYRCEDGTLKEQNGQAAVPAPSADVTPHPADTAEGPAD